MKAAQWSWSADKARELQQDAADAASSCSSDNAQSIPFGFTNITWFLNNSCVVPFGWGPYQGNSRVRLTFTLSVLDMLLLIVFNCYSLLFSVIYCYLLLLIVIDCYWLLLIVIDCYFVFNIRTLSPQTSFKTFVPRCPCARRPWKVKPRVRDKESKDLRRLWRSKYPAAPAASACRK